VPVIADAASPKAAAEVSREVAATSAAAIDSALVQRWEWSGDPDIWEIPSEPARKAGDLYRRLLRRPAATTEGWFAQLAAGTDGPTPSLPSRDEPSNIFYTSGTTSRPKAVELSQAAIHSHVATLVRQFGYDSGSLILNLLPWH